MQSNCCVFPNYKSLTVSYLLSLEKATTTVSHGSNTAETACDSNANFQHHFHTGIILLACWIFTRFNYLFNIMLPILAI